MALASLAGRYSIILGNKFCIRHAPITCSRCRGRSRAVLLTITTRTDCGCCAMRAAPCEDRVKNSLEQRPEQIVNHQPGTSASAGEDPSLGIDPKKFGPRASGRFFVRNERFDKAGLDVPDPN